MDSDSRNVTADADNPERFRLCECGRKIIENYRRCHCGRVDPSWSILNDTRIEEKGECWIWTGNHNSAGYGTYADALVHRLVWIEVNGEIPEGYEICHSCDVKLCVRPSHLFRGTHAENMADAHAKGRLDTSNLTRWVAPDA